MKRLIIDVDDTICKTENGDYKNSLPNKELVGKPDNEMLEFINSCPVCNSTKCEYLYTNLKDTLYNTGGLWNLNKCTNCHSAYLNPRYNLASIINAYDTYHTHESCGNLNSQGDVGVITLLKNKIISRYIDFRFMGNRSFYGLISYILVLLKPTTKSSLDIKYRNLPIIDGGKSLLDVGFGDGKFLNDAESIGWKTLGIDIDNKVISNALEIGLNVKQANIEDLGKDEIFNYITLSHVIEHLHDPITTIRSLHDLLDSGGKLWIQTPNINAYSHSETKINWRGIEAPRHLVLFNHQSLKKLLLECGFEKVSIYHGNNLSTYEWMTKNSTDGVNTHRPKSFIANFIHKTKILMAKNKSEFITVVATKY